VAEGGGHSYSPVVAKGGQTPLLAGKPSPLCRTSGPGSVLSSPCLGQGTKVSVVLGAWPFLSSLPRVRPELIQ
jgi:hypothetical protein